MLNQKKIISSVFSRIVDELNEISGKPEDEDIVIRRFLSINLAHHDTEEGVNAFLAGEGIDELYNRLEHIVCNNDIYEDDVNEFVEECVLKYLKQPSQTMMANMFHTSMFDAFYEKYFIINADDCMGVKPGEAGWFVIKKENLTINLANYYNDANDELDCREIVRLFNKKYKECQSSK